MSSFQSRSPARNALRAMAARVTARVNTLLQVKRATALVAASLLAAGCEGANPTPSVAQQRTLPPPSAAPAAISASRRTAITTAVEKVSASVVTVQTESVQRMQPDFFSFMFGEGGREQRNAGIGSGFIIRADGVVVTNAHVVAGATSVTIAMRDGTTYPAKVVGTDETNDIAVVKVDAKNLPVSPLGTSADLLVGEWAIAIGNPFGFVLGNNEPSVSVGVISAVGRNLAGRNELGGVYLDMIQTDAAINPGNSGGPLVNATGDVIGVNSSIYSPSGGSVGLGFAIPIDRTKRIAEDLLEHGAVRQSWVGIRLQASQVKSAREAASVGAVVGYVVPGSPAQKAGVQVGDEIVRAGNRTVKNPFEWEARLLDLRVGEAIPIALKRGSREVTMTLTVAEAPEVGAERVTIARDIDLITLTPSIRGERAINAGAGAVVARVSDNAAAAIGLQVGDVIVQVNNRRVTTAEEASTAITRQSAVGPVSLYFERNGRNYQTPPFSLRR
ncbi:MAG: trypsin-like peptidase domain-containing protein [Gemmatimonas sp.]